MAFFRYRPVRLSKLTPNTVIIFCLERALSSRHSRQVVFAPSPVVIINGLIRCWHLLADNQCLVKHTFKLKSCRGVFFPLLSTSCHVFFLLCSFNLWGNYYTRLSSLILTHRHRLLECGVISFVFAQMIDLTLTEESPRCTILWRRCWNSFRPAARR